MSISFCKQQLLLVRAYEFVASTKKCTETREGAGKGIVKAEKETEGSIIFFENGFFENLKGKFKSHNIYRWKFNETAGNISLEHLRFGFERPVFLFTMIYHRSGYWISESPYICGKDEYHAAMMIENSSAKLKWSIASEKQNQQIDYTYFI